MKRSHIKLIAASAALLCGFSSAAHADLDPRMFVLPVYQVGTTGQVSFGVTVTASTNLSGIWANAGYQIDCSNPNIRPALVGGRGWSDNGFSGPRSITVTSPTNLPARQTLPGWSSVMAGDNISCVLTARGSAKTSFLPIGSGGASFPVGGDSWESTESVVFDMVKTGLTFGIGCIA